MTDDLEDIGLSESDKGLMGLLNKSRVLQFKSGGGSEKVKNLIAKNAIPDVPGIKKVLRGFYEGKLKGLFGFSQAFNAIVPSKREYFPKKTAKNRINTVKFQLESALSPSQVADMHLLGEDSDCRIVYFDDLGYIYSAKDLVRRAFEDLLAGKHIPDDADFYSGLRYIMNVLSKAVLGAHGSPPKVNIIKNKTELDALAGAIRAHSPRPIVLDIETDGLDAFTNNIVGIGICMDASEGYYIPLTMPQTVFNQTFFVQAPEVVATICKPSEVADFVKETLCKQSLVIHNAKFEMQFFKAAYGVDLNVLLDTMVGEYILDCRLKGRFNLGKSVAERFPLVEEWKESDAFFKNLRNIEIGVVANYCVRDCVNEFLLMCAQYAPLMRDYKYLTNEVDLPFITVLTEAEMHGFTLDKEYLKNLKATLAAKVADIDVKLKEALPDVNIDSGQQLSKALYETLGLPILKRTASGAASVDADTLEQLHKQTNNETLSLILDRRGYNKLAATYTTSFIEKCNAVTGNVHPSFSNIATETGRLACHSPNF